MRTQQSEGLLVVQLYPAGMATSITVHLALNDEPAWNEHGARFAGAVGPADSVHAEKLLPFLSRIRIVGAHPGLGLQSPTSNSSTSSVFPPDPGMTRAR